MTYARKTLSEIKLIHGDYGNFIKGQKLPKDKEKKYKTPPYRDLAASNEIDGETLNEKCWPGYEKKGMKTMFGKRYPNCVKKKKTRKEEYSDWRSELESIQERKIGKGKDEFFIDSTGKKKRMSQATRQDVGMAPKDPINVTPTGFRAKVDNVKNFLKQKVKLPKSASKVPGVKGAAKLLSKTPKDAKSALVVAGLLGAVAGARAIGRKFNEIRKKRKDAAIDKQVDKYVADRKGPISKVNYMPDNMYTVKRDKDGKATGTGDQIRVVPGTRTIKRMPEPGDNKKKSRFSQHTRMKLGNYGSLSPMDEATMTPAQKRKDTMLKKKYEKSDDMMDSFKDQYGKKKGEEVFYAFIRKKSMEEENIQEILDKKDIPHVKKLVGKLRKGSKTHAKQADDLEKAMNEDMSDKDFKKLNKDMHDTAKAGGGASQEIQNKYALELARRRKINKDGTVSTLTNKALKNEETAIESELLIQDWNKDDIKFTEIETVDIIKAKPLKEEHSEWRLDEKFSFLKGLGKTIIKGTGSSKLAGLNPRLSKLASFNAAKIRGQNIMSKLLGKKLKLPIDPIVNPNLTLKNTDDSVKSVRRVQKQIERKKINPNAVFPTVAQNKIKGELIKGDEFKNISTRDYIKKKKTNIKKKGDDDTPSLMASYDWRAELGEDWQKVNRQDKTDGLSKKAVKAYRRENPGSKLKTAVTKDPKKLKKGSKDAKRRLSFCRRMKGMKKKLTSAKTRRDPDSRINKALRRWNC